MEWIGKINHELRNHLSLIQDVLMLVIFLEPLGAENIVRKEIRMPTVTTQQVKIDL